MRVVLGVFIHIWAEDNYIITHVVRKVHIHIVSYAHCRIFTDGTVHGCGIAYYDGCHVMVRYEGLEPF
jgi:hypothetical protein